MRRSNMLVLFTGLIICITGCKRKKDSPKDPLSALPGQEVHFTAGDVFAFEDSTKRYFAGALFVYEPTKNGIWYGLCLSNYYDREIPASVAGLEFSGSEDEPPKDGRKKYYFDLVWFRDTVFINNRGLFRHIGNINMLPLTLSITREDSAYDYTGITRAFYRAIDESKYPAREWVSITE